MKILLFGKSGQVGWELQRSLAPLGELVAPSSCSSELCGDFEYPDRIAHTIKAVAPDVIVNAAAHTAVDKAESEPDKAHVINAHAPAVLAQEAHKLDAWLVHYSSDYVFDGHGTHALARDGSDRAIECIWPNQAGSGESNHRFRLSPLDFSHKLGLCRAGRKLRQNACYALPRNASV